MLWFEAIFLGIVQGMTEFIPVSSSGHLVIVPYLAGWEHPGLAFDVAMHLGTAAAVVVYFRRELFAMARGVITRHPDADARVYRRLALLVAVASVPVAAAGLFLEALVGQAFEQPLVVAGSLMVTALLLVIGERRRSVRVRQAAQPSDAEAQQQPVPPGSGIGGGDDDGPAGRGLLPLGEDPVDPAGSSLERMTVTQALVAGVFQVAALMPGISRSGSTISGAMLAGMTREAATRFSFLLSLPALVGAFALSLPDLRQPSDFSGAMIAAGVAASFVSGYVAVRFLVAMVARDRLTGFAGYCVFVAVLTIIAYQFLGPPSGV
ncbi:MAG: hypothetical protein GEU74_12620 [Nitriliruptorales bacterium]|nr:hypothetical protein [Nitriliruptorales bacterium]